MIARIAEAVASKLALDDWTWNAILTPMGYDLVASKCILQIRSHRSSSRFLVKMSNSHRLNYYVEKEANNMLTLSRFGVNWIPEMILHESFGGRSFIVERFVEGEKLHASSRWLDPIFHQTKGWLTELYAKAGLHEVSAEELIKRTQEHVETSKEFFDIDDSLVIMERHKPQGPIPATWIHGDFWHGNMIKDHAGHVWMTDFSMSSGNEPPVDVFDLILDYEPDLLSSSRELAPYILHFLPADFDPIFLILYNLIRKLALKVGARKMLYEEMLLFDLRRGMDSIEEAGVLRKLISHRGRPSI